MTLERLKRLYDIKKAVEFGCATDEEISEAEETEAFIRSVADPDLRLILLLRFVDRLDWCEIAACLDKKGIDSVKKRCYRFLEKTKQLS